MNDVIRDMNNILDRFNLPADIVDTNDIFWTVIIGQITIYAILLAFYEFMVSLQQEDEVYLGYRVIPFYVNQKCKAYRCIISKKWFSLLFLIGIIYNPIIYITQKKIGKNILIVLNTVWYLYVIFFFFVFAIAVVQSMRCVLAVKLITNLNEARYHTEIFNKAFRKHSLSDMIKKTLTELFVYDVGHLIFCVEHDSNSAMGKSYDQLFFSLASDYLIWKKRGIKLKKERGITCRNQKAWVYNLNQECEIIKDYVSKRHACDKGAFAAKCFDVYLEMMELNFQRAELEENNGEFDYYDWIDLGEVIWSTGSLSNKRRIATQLDGILQEVQGKYYNFLEILWKRILYQEICEVFEGQSKQHEFINIYETVFFSGKLEEFYVEKLLRCLIAYNEVNAEELICLMCPADCTFVFVYLVLYYSMYKFRFDWKYININNLKALKGRMSNLEDERDRIDELMMQSRFLVDHRYDVCMLDALENGLKGNVTNQWLEAYRNQKNVDMFYLVIIKLCVYEQHYYAGGEEQYIEDKYYIMSELCKHNELITQKKLERMIFQMRYHELLGESEWPEDVEISLRALLLTNIEITESMILKDWRFKYSGEVGRYLLIKYIRDPMTELQKKIIGEAYISSNQPIESYIEELERECNYCRVELNYVDKEKMKRRILEII